MSDRQARLDRNLVSHKAERDIDRLFLPLSRAVGSSVRRHAKGVPLTRADYKQIMADVDTAIANVTGRYPGDTTAPLYRAVVARCGQARQIAFQRAVEMVRGKLRGEPELLKAIEGEMSR